MPSEIESLLIIDRSTDLITPMCSQLTYEGLLDEVFGIDNSMLASFGPSYLFAQCCCVQALRCYRRTSCPRMPTESLFPQNSTRATRCVCYETWFENPHDDKTIHSSLLHCVTSTSPKWARCSTRPPKTCPSSMMVRQRCKVRRLRLSCLACVAVASPERHEAKSVSQMKQFTSKLKRLQVGADAFLHKARLTCLSQDEKASIKLHTDIATELNDIARSAKFMNTLEIEQAWLGPCTM